ncbi:outer membrane receptor protein involved in Fe transport [Chitinophaga niastensis]|uniref:Outer membrane receptor protein involved in Fe transport n=1 Tax=Chitinophaga niastensis TaxID=536980 RepID=A0A2P8HVV5_CHINA|nr:outer membrane beta-barrel protein [Chitinophaga niastensis]PSL50294.1 outer membrane receptor protein involved in Fe transport [Chitinophaga niastensis]
MNQIRNKWYSSILMLFFTLLTTAVKGQQYRISGTVSDTAGRPVNQAKIVLLPAITGKPIKEVSSAETGAFSFSSIDSGTYQLKIQHPFYADYIHVISIKESNVTLDRIILTPPIVNLKDITIQGRKPLIEQKIDRTVFNVENSVALSGANTLDAIGKLPGVRITGGNGIMLTGRGQVNVLIDDRFIRLSGDDLLSLLKSIPASNIVRIELISNPPAKYDAAGSHGLINIVTRRKKENGLNGSINAAYSQAYYGSANIGGLLSYTKGKWSINTSLSVSDNQYNELTNPTTYYPDQTWQQNRKSKNITKSILGRLGIDYQISKKQLFGITYSNNAKNADANEYSVTNIYSPDNKMDSLVKASNTIHRETQSHDISLHYENIFSSAGDKLTLDGGYFTFHNHYTQLSGSSSYLTNDHLLSDQILQSVAPQNINAYTMQADITLPRKFANLSFGGKVSFIHTGSSANYYQQLNNKLHYDSALSNAFDYRENLQALYVNGNRQWKKWGLQLGLRGEYTQTTGYSITYQQTNHNAYFKLFPTVFVSYKQKDDNTFVLSYGKRINRPNYWYLNPFKQYVSPYFYYEGNPFLQPTYNNNFDFTWSYRSMFITKVFATIANNVFDQILLSDSVTKVTKLTRLNYYSQRNFGISQSLNLTRLSWWESYNTASLYYINTKSTVSYTAGHSGWGADLYSGNTFIFNKDKTLSGTMDFTYTFPQLSGVYKFDAYYSFDLGFRVLLLNKKLTLGANATDIFRTSKSKFYAVVNNITTRYNNYFDNRAVRLSLSYKFGKSDKPKRQAKASNTEEKNRAY